MAEADAFRSLGLDRPIHEQYLAFLGRISAEKRVDRAVEIAVEQIAKLSIKVKGSDDIAKVGTVSANGDAEIAVEGLEHHVHRFLLA